MRKAFTLIELLIIITIIGILATALLPAITGSCGGKHAEECEYYETYGYPMDERPARCQ